MKGVNFKTFFLNHGEKFGFGLFLILALCVLLLGTSWGRYERTPAELREAADKAEKVILDSKWPDDQKKELTDWTDIVKRTDQLLVGLDASKYSLTTELSVPVYPVSQPILEPKFLAPEKMLATASEVLIELPPKEEDEDEDDADSDDKDGKKKKKDDEDEELPPEFRKRKSLASEGTDSLSAEYPGGGDAMGYGADEIDLASMSSEYGMEGLGEGGEAEKKALEGEGHRFVAVRGVIDWQAQKAAYAKALNLRPEQAVMQEPTMNGFEIERQKMVPGPDPWSGPWEKLNITNSIDVIMKAVNLEPELLDITITDPAVTEPLPQRVIGDWSKWATHPDVENFQLSPKEQEAEQLRQEMLLKANEQFGGLNQMPDPVEPGGFKKVVRNVRGIESGMSSMMGDAGYASKMRGMSEDYADMAKEYGYEDAMGEGGLLAGKRTAASGRLMLFRYFDFDVEPGATYRYRVRIEYLNPNFGRPIDTLAQPEFQVGQTRYSDWSEPTGPATVRPEAEYFLTEIKKGRGVAGENASMDVFQWRSEFGTVVNQVLDMGVGDSIGKAVRTRVVNPLDESFEDKPVSISTGDIVVDLADDQAEPIDSTLDGLDAIPSRVRYDQAVVMTLAGKLKVIDPITSDKDRREARKMQGFQNKLGQEYEEAAKEAEESSLESLAEGGESGFSEGSSEGGSRSSKKRRRRSNAAAY